VRWALIIEATVRNSQPIPLVIDLREYGRWECPGQKGFVRFLEEAPVWYQWPHGLLDRLLTQPGRAVLLLDGLAWIPTEGELPNEIVVFSTFSGPFPPLRRSCFCSSMYRFPPRQSFDQSPLIPTSTPDFPGFRAVVRAGLDEIAPI
jgi:hypothetical protein